MSGLGLPTHFLPTAGQGADVTHAPALLDGATPAVVIADKGYDKKGLVEAIEAAGGPAVIPTRKTRKGQRVIDRDPYRERNLVGRLWAKAKVYRRVATR